MHKPAGPSIRNRGGNAKGKKVKRGGDRLGKKGGVYTPSLQGHKEGSPMGAIKLKAISISYLLQ